MEVLLGVSGCIGAYKIPELIRLLRAGGAGVTVIRTQAAGWFVADGALQTLSERPVYADMFAPKTASGIEHIDLARRADIFLVAPATANCVGKLANGIADDFLSTVYLACRCPVLVAPAMNSAMYAHPAVQANLATLQARGVSLLGPASGDLACGETGPGRMLEPATLAATVLAMNPAGAAAAWSGLHVVVSSGPTREPLDAVRFLSNPSTGRMGHALAAAAARRGAKVTLVSGPTHLPVPPGVDLVPVERVAEMRRQVMAASADADLVFMAAAVGDYQLQDPAAGKVKKAADGMTLKLLPAPDILAELGAGRREGSRPVLIGFAAETDDMLVHARRKLEKKKVDHIVANLVGQPGTGFAGETNQVTVLSRDGDEQAWPMLSKTEVAERLMDMMHNLYFAAPAGSVV